MDKKYKIKRIYYLLLGLYETIDKKERLISQKIINQYNNMIEELEDLLNEDLQEYKIDDSERYDTRSFHTSVLNYQIYPIIKYLENMHINSSDYQINKVGYLYRSIEDKTLKDRCGDILLGETAFDRAVNQATQIIEDRIKNKAGLDKSNLIGLNLISKAIHAKIDKTILKFSDNPDIQEGFSNLFKGIISIYRNPSHHSLSFECTREYALKFCAYIDELLNQVDNCEIIEENK